MNTPYIAYESETKTMNISSYFIDFCDITTVEHVIRAMFADNPEVASVSVVGSSPPLFMMRTVVSLIMSTPSVRTVSIGVYEFKDSGIIDAYTDMIRNTAHLECLCLDFDFHGNEKHHCVLIGAICANKNLKKLRLSGRFDTRAKLMSIVNIFELAKSVVDLKLVINASSPEIDDALRRAFKLNTTITKFELRPGFSRFNVAKVVSVIARGDNLTSLTMSGIFSGPFFARVMAWYISASESLTRLSLVDCQLNDECMQILGPALEVNTRITHLDLSFNVFAHELLRTNARTLKVESTSDAKTLPVMISNNTSITSLDVMRMHIRDPIVMTALCAALNAHPRIEKLRADRHFTSVECINILFNALAHNTVIKKFLFIGSSVSMESIEELCFMLRHNRCIRSLDIKIKRDMVDRVRDALESNTSIVEFVSRPEPFQDILERNKHNKTQKAVTLFDTYKHALDHQEPCSSSSKRLRTHNGLHL